MSSNAGLVLITEFDTAKGSKAFAGFIEYLDDDKKTKKNENDDTYDDGYAGFVDYMDDALKSRGLFSATGMVSDECKKEIKELATEAQSNGSNIWKTVISFDEDFLKEYGLYDAETGKLDASSLIDYARPAFMHLLKKEGLENAVWTGSIHQNLDIHNNYHIHFTAFEPQPSWTDGCGRCRKNPNGELYQRGVFKNESIKACKSKFFSEITKGSAESVRIGQLRDEIYALRRNTVEKELYEEKFVKLLKTFPQDMRLWKYNNNSMAKYRESIDEFTHTFIKEYCADEFAEYVKLTGLQEERFSKAYGGTGNNYQGNQISNLYGRLGNVLLKEMATYEKNQRQFAKRDAIASAQPTAAARHNLADRGAPATGSAGSIAKKLKRVFSKSIDEINNQIAYERMIKDAEYER